MGSLTGYLEDVVRGRRSGAGAGMVRGMLTAAEMPYRGIVGLRNALFDRGILAAHPLGRPTVSVGNLTAGGTGKTPVVRWLCDQLLARGHQPAVLMRGYAADRPERSDEAIELFAGLGGRVPIEPDPDRVLSAIRVLENRPQTDVFVLDDGFQHRRAARGFDLVLVNAADPFGGGHVHPRGLLREPLSGLSRSHAVLITHASDADDLAPIRREIAGHTSAPIYVCGHEIAGVCEGPGSPPRPMGADESPALLVAGVGHPQGVASAVGRAGIAVAEAQWFGDHHAYTPADWAKILERARSIGAKSILTTGKDLPKLLPIVAANRGGMPLLKLELELRFAGDDASSLLGQIVQRLGLGAVAGAPPVAGD